MRRERSTIPGLAAVAVLVLLAAPAALGDPVSDGVTWLEGDQNAEGSWGSDFQVIVTGTVLETLTTLDACSTAAADGAEWLSLQSAPNFDYLARQSMALAGVPGYDVEALTLANDLLAARRPVEPDSLLPNWPEGGWGIDNGFETDCLTTALALIALDRNRFNGGFSVSGVAIAPAEIDVYQWEIPADATKVRISLTVAGDAVRLRMTEGTPPDQFDPYFELPPGGPYEIVYPDSGIPFTPGTNYISINNPGAAGATYSMTPSYETPTFDTRTLAEPLSYLREAQNLDGGWGLQRGQDSDLYATMHVLLALLRYSQYDLSTETGDGVAYLKTQRLGDGSFGFGGPGIAYVTALAALDLVRSESSPFSVETEDAIAALLATQAVDGSWDQAAYDTALAALALWEHGEPPISDAGPDQAVADSGEDCLEAVTLAGSGTAINGSITSYSWTEDCVEIATGLSPVVDFSAGTHEVTLIVTDSDGQTASDTVVIDVDAAITDSDGDGTPDVCSGCTGPSCTPDCDSGNPDVGSEPGDAVIFLTYSAVTGDTEITWESLVVDTGTDDGLPGSGAPVAYDALRSTDPSDFNSGVACLEADDSDTITIDSDALAPGNINFYLIRGDNACPGVGGIGTDSTGTARTGVDCI